MPGKFQGEEQRRYPADGQRALRNDRIDMHGVPAECREDRFFLLGKPRFRGDGRRIFYREGRISSRMSSARITSLAPSRMSRFVPALRAESTFPGTAKTSRPCSRAKRAVIREPLRRVASTTPRPERKSADNPVAYGKMVAVRRRAEGNSERTAPLEATASAGAPHFPADR